MINNSLSIRTVNASIKIEKTDPKMQIEGQIPELHLEKSKSNFMIHNRPAKLLIDSYSFNRQLERKKIMDVVYDLARYGKRKGREAVAEKSSEGDSMMKIENKGDPIVQIAKNNAYRLTRATVKIRMLDKPVRIDYRKGRIDTSYVPSRIEARLRGKLRIEATPGRVDISANYPKVIVEVAGKNINYKV